MWSHEEVTYNNNIICVFISFLFYLFVPEIHQKGLGFFFSIEIILPFCPNMYFFIPKIDPKEGVNGNVFYHFTQIFILINHC